MPRRNLQILLVGALVVILAAGLAFSLFRLHSLEEVATREIKISMWVTSQPLVELLKLRNALAGFETGTFTADEVREHFEALSSRVPLLTEGRQGEILQEIADVEAAGRTIAAVLEQIRPVVDGIEQAVDWILEQESGAQPPPAKKPRA